MKRILAILFLPLTFISYAQSEFTFNQGGTLQKDYLTVIPYQNIRGKIIAEAVINGEPYRFLVDTGAPVTITKKIQEKLKLSTLTSMGVTDQSDKVGDVEIVSLLAITFGGIQFNNIPTIVVPDESMIFVCFQIDGIIGSNLLRNSVIQFNDVKKEITLTDSGKRLKLDSKNASNLYLTPVQSNPYVWINLKGEGKARNQLLFDSGMDGIYDLALRNYAQFEKKKVFNVISQSTGANTIGIHGAADNTIQFKLILPEMDIAGTKIRNMLIQTTSSENSRIGSGILEHGIVTLDYRNKKFYFQSHSERVINLKQTSFPVEPMYRDGQLQIGIVWKESLRDKLKPGDQIVAVDGVNWETIDICNLLTKEPAFKTKKKITLTTRNTDGTFQEIILEQE